MVPIDEGKLSQLQIACIRSITEMIPVYGGLIDGLEVQGHNESIIAIRFRDRISSLSTAWMYFDECELEHGGTTWHFEKHDFRDDCELKEAFLACVQSALKGELDGIAPRGWIGLFRGPKL